MNKTVTCSLVCWFLMVASLFSSTYIYDASYRVPLYMVMVGESKYIYKGFVSEYNAIGAYIANDWENLFMSSHINVDIDDARYITD